MNSKLNRHKPGNASAFTLLELGVVIAVTAVLFAILIPALAASKPASHGFQCLENQRRLMLAWRLYSNDFSDKLVFTGGIGYTATFLPSTLATNGNWVHGDQSNPSSSINPALIQAGSLFPYSKSTVIYKCPADRKTGGGGLPTTRSVSMNGWLNPMNPSGPSSLGRIFKNQSDITNPPPANLWVFIDESPNLINDGFFVCDPFNFPNTWVDFPASYHEGGCGISFADGHAMIRKWSDPVLFKPNSVDSPPQQNPPVDLNWLQARSTSHQ